MRNLTAALATLALLGCARQDPPPAAAVVDRPAEADRRAVIAHQVCTELGGYERGTPGYLGCIMEVAKSDLLDSCSDADRRRAEMLEAHGLELIARSAARLSMTGPAGLGEALGGLALTMAGKTEAQRGEQMIAEARALCP